MYYPGPVICLSDLGNILAYYLDKTTLISLLYKHKIKVEIKSTDLDEEDTDELVLLPQTQLMNNNIHYLDIPLLNTVHVHFVTCTKEHEDVHVWSTFL